MQRMFAGGQVTTVTPLQIGSEVSRETSVIATTKKQGRSGALTFITVRSAFHQDGQLAIVDEQEVMHRSDRRSYLACTSIDATPYTDADDRPLRMDVDPILLFRFSALTYNAHRIHYDLEYVRREGYPDLVFTGRSKHC